MLASLARMRVWMAPLLALAVAPAAAAPAPAPAPAAARTPIGLPVTSFELGNGMRVALHEDHATPSVIVYLWFRVGSKDETAGHTGFAHLFEHLMFEGSRHVPEGQFDLLLEGAGGWSQGTTTTDRTNYYEELPSSHLELALWLDADRLAGLWDAMNMKVFRAQRDIVKNERRESVDEAPYGRAEEQVQQALWPPGHGNHNLTIGTMEDLDRATLAEVEAFWRRYYVPSNCTLVIAGDIDIARTRALVERYFGWMPKVPEPVHRVLDRPVEPRAGAVTLTARDRVQATKLMLTWRSPTPFTRESRDLEVAAQMLAGSKSGRLYRRLVIDDRLAEWVRADQAPQLLGGQFGIEVMMLPGADPARAAQAVREEVAAMAARPPSADEVARAVRTFEVGSIAGLESLVARADQIAEYAAYTGDPGFFARDLELSRATTAAGVHAAVKKWLGPDASVQMIVTPEGGK
ncbi:MAG TPA: pitrilysin family protein [Kofleriaceae bacterium]|nr:pitrilysin family protein [Kofleriaceae bacterium]